MNKKGVLIKFTEDELRNIMRASDISSESTNIRFTPTSFCRKAVLDAVSIVLTNSQVNLFQKK